MASVGASLGSVSVALLAGAGAGRCVVSCSHVRHAVRVGEGEALARPPPPEWRAAPCDGADPAHKREPLGGRQLRSPLRSCTRRLRAPGPHGEQAMNMNEFIKQIAAPLDGAGSPATTPGGGADSLVALSADGAALAQAPAMANGGHPGWHRCHSHVADGHYPLPPPALPTERNPSRLRAKARRVRPQLCSRRRVRGIAGWSAQCCMCRGSHGSSLSRGDVCLLPPARTTQSGGPCDAKAVAGSRGDRRSRLRRC